VGEEVARTGVEALIKLTGHMELTYKALVIGCLIRQSHDKGTKDSGGELIMLFIIYLWVH